VFLCVLGREITESSTEFMSTNVGTGLLFVIAAACLRFLGCVNYASLAKCMDIQGGSNMTGTNCDLFTHKQSRSYLNHLVN
jgi:hypothetical protein